VNSGADGGGHSGEISAHYSPKNITLLAGLKVCVQEAGRGIWLAYYINNKVDDGLTAECDEV